MTLGICYLMFSTTAYLYKILEFPLILIASMNLMTYPNSVAQVERRSFFLDLVV